MKTGLTVQTFGGLQMSWQGTAVAKLKTRKAEALLVFLTCNPKPHSRDKLMTLLWGDSTQERAANNLSIALGSFRKLLPGAVASDRYQVQLNPECQTAVDAVQFEAILAGKKGNEVRTRAGIRPLLQAMALYRGDFLEGFHIRAAPEFEDWLFLQRAHFQQRMMGVLAKVAQHHALRSQFETAVQIGRRQLGFDELDESVHRNIMTWLFTDGKQAAALEQFEQCVQILAKELGVPPEEQTAALFEKIKAGTALAASPTLPVIRAEAQHNLPAQSDAFVGREGELLELEKLFNEQGERLITLLGPGGVGKTRLALQLARDQARRFLDGAWFIALDEVESPDFLLTAVATAINLPFAEHLDAETQLLNYCRDKEMLLIFDNFEHLVEEAGFLKKLLQKAPAVQLLVTTRERLNVQAETIFEVSGLPCPPEPESEQFVEFGAVRLFINRVQKVQPNFAVTAEIKPAVAQICHLVAGTPIALELAAAGMRYQSCGDIAANLDSNLDLLSVSARDIPPRHRSLRAVFDHSWALLSEAEQSALPILTIFRGPFPLQVGVQVSRVSLTALHALADKSFLLLQTDKAGSPTGHAEMHPLLRQFAAEKLTQTAVAQHHKTAVQSYQQLMKTPAQAPPASLAYHAYRSLLAGEPSAKNQFNPGIEPDWVLNVLTLLLEAGKQALASYAASDARRFFQRSLEISRFYQMDGATAAAAYEGLAEAYRLQGELYNSLQNYLEAATILEGMAEPSLSLVTLFGKIGALYGRIGEAEKGLQEINKAWERLKSMPESTANNEVKALLHIRQGAVHFRLNQSEKGIEQCRLGLELAEELPTSARGLNTLGTLFFRTGQFDEAMDAFSKSKILFEELNNPYRIAQLEDNIATIFFLQDAWEKARLTREKALEFWQKIGDFDHVGQSHFNLGNIYLCQGDWETAQRSYQQALDLARQQNNQRLSAYARTNLGLLHIEQGKWLEAEKQILLSEQVANKLKLTHLHPWNQIATAQIYLQKGINNQARRHARKAVKGAENFKLNLELAIAQRILGLVLIKDGDEDSGWQQLEKSLTLCREINNQYELGRTLAIMDQYSPERIKDNKPTPYSLEASDIFHRLGAVKDLEKLKAIH